MNRILHLFTYNFYYFTITYENCIPQYYLVPFSEHGLNEAHVYFLEHIAT